MHEINADKKSRTAAPRSLKDRRALAEAVFERLAAVSPAPKTELEYFQPLHPAGRGRALGPGDGRGRQQGDLPGLFKTADTPARMVALGEAWA